jgi:ribose-phosphate pyrophosphokinase
MAIGELKILSGNANPALAQAMCDHLGCELTPCMSETFSDGEIRIEIKSNVRGADVFVVQPTCNPVNFHLMELCIILDALKRASVGRVTAVVPYYGYSRQDRKVAPRSPISAKLVADILQVAGIDRLVTIDLHAGQIQGYFDLPVDNLYAMPVLLEPLKERMEGNELIMVSPDAGGTERARTFGKRLNAGLAVIDKRRDAPNKAAAMNVIGDVKDKICVICDDMIDTAGTICAASEILMEKGAKEVVAVATHAVFSGPALKRLNDSPIAEIVVTDTIPFADPKNECPKVNVNSVAGLLGKAIHNIHTESSVSVLFV